MSDDVTRRLAERFANAERDRSRLVDELAADSAAQGEAERRWVATEPPWTLDNDLRERERIAFVAGAAWQRQQPRREVEDVLALHAQGSTWDDREHRAIALCTSDGEDWPCPTVAAITARLGGA